MCFSHIQVKLTHVIQKCSTGPQIIFFVKFFQVHCQQYVVKGDATLHSDSLL